jgi:hypothetical protein
MFKLHEIEIENSGLLRFIPKRDIFNKKMGFGKFSHLRLIDVIFYQPEYFRWVVENVEGWASKNLITDDLSFISRVFKYQQQYHDKMMSYRGGVHKPYDDWDTDGGERF